MVEVSRRGFVLSNPPLEHVVARERCSKKLRQLTQCAHNLGIRNQSCPRLKVGKLLPASIRSGRTEEPMLKLPNVVLVPWTTACPIRLAANPAPGSFDTFTAILRKGNTVYV